MLTYIPKDYLTTNNGIFYFQRRVPKDVRSHYKSHAIACSLKTRSRRIALRAASSLSLQLEEYWMDLRVNQLTSIHCQKLKISPDRTVSGVSFMKAKDLYLKLKRQPRLIKRIQSACMDMNNNLRWVIALVSDTGMRLAEVCGLERNDVVLDTSIPHIILQPNSARRLKTESSERNVPLVGLPCGQLLRILSCLVGHMKSIYFLGIPRVVNAMLIQLVLL
jgi:integrase